MSDYMFMLDSHLSPTQRRAVAEIDEIAADAGFCVFLTGGAMRDMLGGFPISDLDFTVQGNALALVKKVASKTGSHVISTDTLRNSAELRFPSGVTAEIGMARAEFFAKPGSRPKVRPATIHEDLLRRDFTINSIALSLHPASRGLLLDPSNGLGDLERRELRTSSNFSFYDDPIRLLRLIRFRVRFGFTVHERTQQHYDNARAAGMESHIPARLLLQELQEIAQELNSGEVMMDLEQENLIHLFSPALAGSKLNSGALAKLQKARQMIPFGVNLNYDHLGLFLYCLTEKLTAKDKTELSKHLVMSREVVDSWQKLAARSRKLAKDLMSSKLHRPSDVYEALNKTPCEQVLFQYLNSSERLVHDRIRNYLQKYLLTAQEVNDRDVIAAGYEFGSPQFDKAKEEMILALLDGRKWKPASAPAKQKPKKTDKPARKSAVKRAVPSPAKQKPKKAAKPTQKNTVKPSRKTRKP